MEQLKALEQRVAKMEKDEDFAPTATSRPAATKAGKSKGGASSAEVNDVRDAASFLLLPTALTRSAPSQLKKENEALKAENAQLAKLLGKERYRIKHLINTVETLSA